MERIEKNANPINDQPKRAFCAFCGKPLLPTAKFCAYCGQAQVEMLEKSAQPVQVIVVPAPPKPIDKRARKKTLFFVLEIVFAFLALLLFILMRFIKFKTNHIEIIFWNGAKKSVINHDLTMYKLWCGGLILASVFMVLALVCVIMHYRFSDRFSLSGLGLVILLGIVLLGFLIGYLDRLPEINEDHEVIEMLAEKRTTKDFVPYNEKRYKNKST